MSYENEATREQRTQIQGLWLDLLAGHFSGRPYLRVEQTPTDIARGLVSGSRPEGSFGERSALAGEVNRVVWPNGVFSLPPAAGVQMSIVSTSANDTAAGTNVRSLELHYLDDALIEKTELITLNGLTPVLTVATNIRFINSMHIQTYGTNAFAGGTITASNGGTTYSQIAASDTRSASSMRMVPAGKKCFVAGASASSTSGTSAARVTTRLVASELDNHQYIDPLILIPFGSIGTQDSSEAFNFPVPLPFSAGTVIGFTESTDKDAFVSASWFGWIEDA